MITRREFFGVGSGCALAAPFGTDAQDAGRLPRIALVFNTELLADVKGVNPSDRFARALVHGLRDLGLVEGRGIIIEFRSAEGRPERMPALMQEVAGLPVDVIVTMGYGAQAALRATDTISIVALVDSPDSIGLTASLARPDRNITGLTATADSAIHGKRLQLLKEIAPKSARVAVIDFKYIDSRETPGTHLRRRATEVAARDLGLTLIAVGVDKPEEFKQGFARIISDRADAVLETGNSVTYEHMRQIIDFAARQRLPAIYTLREFAESGGLMSYGSNFADRMRRAATFVEKILKGTKPADMPFQQPTKYELVINLKTARALDLSIPHSLLLRADEVIE